MIGPGWHVQTFDITHHGSADPRPNPPEFVPVNADGSFRIPRLTKGDFWIAVVIPSLDEIGVPIRRWMKIVTVPQQESEIAIDADEYQPAFVEGTVRLSEPGCWRRLVVLAQEQPPPRHLGSWFVPEPRYGVLDARGHFRFGLPPG